MVKGIGFRVKVIGFRVEGLRFMVKGFGFKVKCFEVITCVEYSGRGLEFRVKS